MFSDFTVTANTIGGTSRKSEKEQILAAFLQSLDDAALERAVTFFAGSPFPRRDQRVTGVGWSAIAEAAVEASGRTADELWEIYPRYADLGDAVAEFFADRPGRAITISEVGESFDRLAATSAGERKSVLVELFRQLDAQGARFVVKILQSEARIGLQEGLVESAIARAYGRSLDSVRRANMLTGDIGSTALLARSDTLDTAKMSLFHPFAFMLAQPQEDPEEIVAALGAGALADDKYDGVRAQIHADGSTVRIYSRTLDDVTHRFPEITAGVAALGRSVILDGEIVAFRDHILPFAIVQKRLGRRQVTPKLLADAPVVFFAFDLLFVDGEALFERPLLERLTALRLLLHGGESARAASPDDVARQADAGAVRLSEQSRIRDAAHVDELFDAARARANEGLVIKDPQSIYTPGRRGKAWLKYKKALATLDCVVTYAQYGNGKRRAVLSDLTFGIRRDDEIVNIGKAYSGLTDVEIATLTEHFKATTIERHGPVHRVEPTVVLEIAFDRIQESKRHKAGFALRFPRIVRIRDDKRVEQIATIDEVRRIYEGQLRREQPPAAE